MLQELPHFGDKKGKGPPSSIMALFMAGSALAHKWPGSQVKHVSPMPWHLIRQGHPKFKTSICITCKSLSIWAPGKIFSFPCTLSSLVSIDYFPLFPICPRDFLPLPGMTCLTCLSENSTHHLISDSKFAFLSATPSEKKSIIPSHVLTELCMPHL